MVKETLTERTPENQRKNKNTKMKMNKKGLLRDVLISFILVCTVVAGLVFVATDLYSHYAVNIEPQYQAFYNSVGNTVTNATNTATDITQKIESSEGMTASALTSLVGGSVFAAIKLPFTVVGSIATLLMELTVFIPGFGLFVGAFITIVSLVVIFLIISALRGGFPI